VLARRLRSASLGNTARVSISFTGPVIQIVERTGFAPALFPIVIGSTLPAQIAFTLVVVSGSVLVAALSWHLFEARLLRLKRNFARGSTTSLATETNVSGALASRST